MGKYQKDFVGWAKVAEEIEAAGRAEICKEGAVYWLYAGVNVGSEVDGKGKRFTRPAVILRLYGDRMALVVFTTTKLKTGRYYFPVVVGGQPVAVILNQIKVVDRLRLGDFIDELPLQELEKIRYAVADLISKGVTS